MSSTPPVSIPSPAPNPGRKRIDYKWIALSVTTIGAMMAAIDATIVILALPDMMLELHADLVEMIWVIIGYILVSTVFLLTFGRVADLFGRVLFQGVRGFDPLTAALLLIPLPLVSSVAAPVGGIIADRIGARVPATIGLLLQAAGLLWLSGLSVDTNYAVIAGGLAVMGLGGGLFFSPNTSAAMTAAPKNRLGIASAALGTLRQTGMVVSLALSLAVAAGSLPRDVMMQIFVGTNVTLGSQVMQNFMVGIRNAFLFSIVLCLAAAVLSFARGKEDRKAAAAREEHPR